MPRQNWPSDHASACIRWSRWSFLLGAIFSVGIVVSAIAHEKETASYEIVNCAEAKDVTLVENILVANVPTEIQVAPEAVKERSYSHALDVDHGDGVCGKLKRPVFADNDAERKPTCSLSLGIDGRGLHALEFIRVGWMLDAINNRPTLDQLNQLSGCSSMIDELIFEIRDRASDGAICGKGKAGLQDLYGDERTFQFGQSTFGDFGASISRAPQLFSRIPQASGGCGQYDGENANYGFAMFVQKINDTDQRNGDRPGQGRAFLILLAVAAAVGSGSCWMARYQ